MPDHALSDLAPLLGSGLAAIATIMAAMLVVSMIKIDPVAQTRSLDWANAAYQRTPGEGSRIQIAKERSCSAAMGGVFMIADLDSRIALNATLNASAAPAPEAASGAADANANCARTAAIRRPSM